MGTILKVEDINVYYGSIHAIKGISFEVQEGEVVYCAAKPVPSRF